MKTKAGPFPNALLLDTTKIGPWKVPLPLRLVVMPLDQPGHHRRDEILLYIEQRTTGNGISATLDLTRVVSIVRWLEHPESFGRVLSLPDTGLAQRPGEAPSIDLVTLVRLSDVELIISLEHWTSGVRKHREVQLSADQITTLCEWLHHFWTDGLPDVLRRRGDESATEFAARRAAAHSTLTGAQS